MTGLHKLKLFGDSQIVGDYTIEIKDFPHKGQAWHRSITIKIKKNTSEIISFSITPILSGCGTSLISQYYIYDTPYNVNKKDLLVIINQILNLYKEDGCGVFFTTLGKGYDIDFLNDLNFKVLSEYPNYRHGKDGSYKQKLLQLIL